MKNITKLILLSSLMIIVFSGCQKETGDSYFNLPEGPKIIFKGGYGKITIRYTPPPDPVFKVATTPSYIEFDEIKEQYGIPDKPILVKFLVDVSVTGLTVATPTANSRFNDYVQKVAQDWTYTRFGRGQMKMKVDVAKKRITVDASEIGLIEPEKGRPVPIVGNPRDLVKATGFTIIAGKL